MKVDESAMEVDSCKTGLTTRKRMVMTSEEFWEDQKMKRELEEGIPLIYFYYGNFAKNVYPKIVRFLEAKGNLKFVENSREADSHINWRKRKFDLGSNCDGDGFAEEEEESEESELEEEEEESEESELEEVESESEENAIKSPVEVKDLSDYFRTLYTPEEEPESEEEVLGDSDRDEKDWGVKFVVKKRSRTVTNPKFPQKTYFRRNPGKRVGKKQQQRVFTTTPSVLHDPSFPVAAISKLALKTYNKIQKTKYKYVGLVKAYQQVVNGFYYWTRFKAGLRGQDAIYFQALTFQERRDPESNVVYVRFESVYPLPPS